MGYIFATVVIATWLLWSSSIHAQVIKDTGVCGSTKGCYSIPSDCNPDEAGSCEAFSSWSLTSDNTSLLINLLSKTNTYIALGFSKSGEMENSDVYACTSGNAVVRSRNGDGRLNEPQTLIGVNVTRVMSVNGTLSCSFVRKLKEDGDDTFFDLTSPNKYTPILAWGGPVQDGRLSQHTDRGFSDTAIDFTIIGMDENGCDPSAKSHGTITLFMLLCSLLVVFVQ